MECIRKSSVVVVGCAGVGTREIVRCTYAIPPQFSNISTYAMNRHATVTPSDVAKVKYTERTFKQISRIVEVDARTDFWWKESGGDFEGVDWVKCM